MNPNWKGRFNLKNITDEHSIEVDPETRERRHKDWPELWTLSDDDPQTILEGFERGMSIAGENADFIGIPVKNEKNVVTGYNYKKFSEVEKDAQQIGLALQKTDLEPGKDFIAFFSANNYAYDASILGGYYRNLANVSLYDTLGESAVEYICNQCEIKLVFVQNAAKLKILFNINTPTLHTVIVIDEDPGKLPEKEGVTVLSFADFMATGLEGELSQTRPLTSDLATINYTSGTTGNPKGVMLTHNALMTTGYGVGEHFTALRPTNDDLWFSYLPLAHIFERVAHITWMCCGTKWCYSGGDMTQVIAELSIAQPTIFGAVPRVLNKLFDKINATLNEPGCVSSIKRGLIHYCMAQKRGYLDQGIVTKDTIWDKKILGPKLQTKLGGKVHSMVCGAAPLNSEVRAFVKEMFSVYFHEGYGQTENGAAACGQIFSNYCADDGCVGIPMPWTGIKLVDVPEMGYFSKDGKGEICFKGANLMKGYYKNEEKTKEAIDEDGWLHSGDIGMWSENKQLKIIDRKKNIFKLSQGEYVAPERLEGIYAKHPLVQQIFIYGNSNESTLVAVIVPEPEGFGQIGKDKNELMKQINTMAKTNDKLKGFEMIRACHIETELFSIENGLLTPTSKAKRPQIQAKYKETLEQLYGEI